MTGEWSDLDVRCGHYVASHPMSTMPLGAQEDS